MKICPAVLSRHAASAKPWSLVLAAAIPLLVAVLVSRFLPSAGQAVPLLLFLLVVVIVATRSGLIPSLVCGVVSALCFNYFYTQPLYTLAMQDSYDVVTLLVFLAVAMLIGYQTDQLRQRTAAQLHAELALTRERADKEREQLRMALTTSLSHDLKTPLATMIGASSSLLSLRQDLSENDQRELTESILAEARRLERYIQNLLDMTRLGRGELSQDRRPTSLAEILNVVRKRIVRAHPQAVLDTRLPAQLPLMDVHPALIEQAIYNLLDNAVKFSPEGAPVLVTARVTDTQLVIDIVDQGPGIPDESREQAFDFFETLGRGDQHAAGEGLGLAIARGMIAAHGGKLRALDTLSGDSGTCMRTELPIDGRM